MNTNEFPGAFPDEGDLAMFAMGALSPQEAAAVTAQLDQDADLRTQLTETGLLLGLYAEAVVNIQPAPARSRERLMSAIASRGTVLPFPANAGARAERADTNSARKPTAPFWAGWAVAAALLVASGLQYQRVRSLHQAVDLQTAQVQHATVQATQVAHERDELRSALDEQVRQAAATRSEALAYKDRSTELRAKVDDEVVRAQRAGQRADQLALTADAAARERDRLQGLVAAQQDQVAQLSTQAATSRQITDALSDPTALRVTLTVPKQKKQPSGRGTYVASNGTLLFAASNLAPLHAGHVYELWLLPGQGGSPIPAGTFVPDASGNATLVSPNFRRAIAATGFAVTVEPAGGSQKPTLPILLAGAA